MQSNGVCTKKNMEKSSKGGQIGHPSLVKLNRIVLCYFDDCRGRYGDFKSMDIKSAVFISLCTCPSRGPALFCALYLPLFGSFIWPKVPIVSSAC